MRSITKIKSIVEQDEVNPTPIYSDANGNLGGDGMHAYRWDAKNHLTRFKKHGS